MKYAKHEIEGIVIYNQLPHPYKNYNHFPSESEETILIEGFLKIEEPTLLDGEEKGELYQDGDVMKHKVVNLQQKAIQDALDAETERYKKRIADGAEYYAKISAEFRLAKLSGAISNEVHNGIEVTLIPVRNEVLAGQWLTSRTNLETIGDAVIGADLYNKLHNALSEYITENYG